MLIRSTLRVALCVAALPLLACSPGTLSGPEPAPDAGDASMLLPDGLVVSDVPLFGDAIPDGTSIDGARPDGGFDAGPVDTGTDVFVDTRVPRCGDSVLDPGESCDDGNNMSGDGCSSMCRFEARCGDHHVDPGEACDDGNNRSGDGCRSDCHSNERCGNGIVDTSVGEVCDSTPGCAAGCRSITTCGNGRIDSGEQCDDGNTTRWDGCAPDCTVEQGVALSSLLFASNDGHTGCDFSGDGRADNAFGSALGVESSVIRPLGLINTGINNGISNGELLLQLSFLALQDRTGQNDADLRVGFERGFDGNAMMVDNLDPWNPQKVNGSLLDAMNLPQAQYQSRITGGLLDGGPEDIYLNLPGPMNMAFNFNLRRSRLSGTITAQPDPGRMNVNSIYDMRAGVLCGAIPSSDIAGLRNFLGLIDIQSLIMGGSMGMDSTNPAGQSSLLEAIAAGYSITFPLNFYPPLRVGPQQPDVDVDGDGLERFETTPGMNRVAPMITACIDGDGTRIPGRDCVRDPRIADGYSAAFKTNAIAIHFVGVQR